MILFNFVSIKAGGGQQNTLSFLENISNENLNFSFIVACTENSLVHRLCIKKGFKHFCVKNSVWSRLKYEFFGFLKLRKIYNIKIIFSIFGSAPIVSPKVYKISGCAYSNIFQPEVDIWGYLGFFNKIFKKIIDIYRILVLLQSNEIILETPYLKKRAVSGLLKNKRVSVIEMAPSKLVSDELVGVVPVDLNTEVYSLLYLSGPQPNKRIDKFLDVLYFLNKNSKKKFILKITMPEESVYYKNILLPKIRRLSLENVVVNIGTIAPQKVANLIKDIDAIVNTALIESFSNNWVEAWASRRLLISIDADWSRASCKDAALYIDVLDPEKSAQIIINTFNDEASFFKIIQNGTNRLLEMPTSKERTQQYLSIINQSLEV
ncbi:glycosyltransferase [Acinetobacter baumannii]|uniref:glycosyltransferase n=1 Tax=Acinetobacter baumannii TaxID=470 RepID=UPI0037DF9F47